MDGSRRLEEHVDRLAFARKATLVAFEELDEALDVIWGRLNSGPYGVGYAGVEVVGKAPGVSGMLTGTFSAAAIMQCPVSPPLKKPP